MSPTHGTAVFTTPDSLWYHLPVAARFAQDGSIYRLHYVDAGSLTVFYPATSELVHAAGMIFLGNDFASLLLNMGWLSLALFAAWCIGWRFGCGSVDSRRRYHCPRHPGAGAR